MEKNTYLCIRSKIALCLLYAVELHSSNSLYITRA